MAAVLVGLVACSSGSEKGAQRTGDDPRAGTAHREKTAAPVAWDYVALGDSLAVGVGASRGYVERYTQHLRSDTGARVEVANLGVSGQTSSQLLATLRNDPSMRSAIGGAEVVTFNIGINDLGHASSSYENGTCGGPHDERCLRVAVEKVEENWDAIIEEILRLRSTNETIIRTAGLGYTPQANGVFEPYLAEVNRHIATSAAGKGIPHAEVRLGGEGMSPDGVHPNDEGYRVIAARLRGLGYEPIGPR